MELSENIEKMLKYGGKAMTILEDFCEEGKMHKGYRMGRREEDTEYDDYGNMREKRERGGYRRM